MVKHHKKVAFKKDYRTRRFRAALFFFYPLQNMSLISICILHSVSVNAVTPPLDYLKCPCAKREEKNGRNSSRDYSTERFNKSLANKWKCHSSWGNKREGRLIWVCFFKCFSSRTRSKGWTPFFFFFLSVGLCARRDSETLRKKQQSIKNVSCQSPCVFPYQAESEGSFFVCRCWMGLGFHR